MSVESMSIRNWDISTIGTDAKIKGRIGWKGYKTSDLRDSGPVVLGGNNIRNSRYLDLDVIKHLSREKYDESPEIQLKKSDILLVTRGNGIGDVSFFNGEIDEATINPSMVIISEFQGIPEFLFYYLISKLGKDNVLSVSSGSSIPAIYQNQLAKVEYVKPPIPEQKAIAATLSVLDDTIELNNQINKKLEEMAQAIFNSWFVDFEPFKDGEFEESELGLIPKGWSVGKFTDYINVLSGGTPKTSVAKYWNGDIPFFTPKDSVNGFYCIKTEKCITEFGLNKCNSRKYEKDTVFITARGTVGKINLSGSNIAMNQSCYALQGKNGLSQYFVFLLTKQCLEMLKKNANGAVFDSIIVNTFGAIRFMLPPREVINKFNTLIQPLFEMNHSCCMETEKLVSLRDTLLPKLMSGEIRVPVKEAV